MQASSGIHSSGKALPKGFTGFAAGSPCKAKSFSACVVVVVPAELSGSGGTTTTTGFSIWVALVSERSEEPLVPWLKVKGCSGGAVALLELCHAVALALPPFPPAFALFS